jgi:hypothetical protein
VAVTVQLNDDGALFCDKLVVLGNVLVRYRQVLCALIAKPLLFGQQQFQHHRTPT